MARSREGLMTSYGEGFGGFELPFHVTCTCSAAPDPPILTRQAPWQDPKSTVASPNSISWRQTGSGSRHSIMFGSDWKRVSYWSEIRLEKWVRIRAQLGLNGLIKTQARNHFMLCFASPKERNKKHREEKPEKPASLSLSNRSPN